MAVTINPTNTQDIFRKAWAVCNTFRGTIDPVSPVTFLMGLRDLDLNVRKPMQLDRTKDLCSDPPAWTARNETPW